MINKNTGLSRGFGFVSFSKEDEAIVAVRSMDGFRLGKKRLKVQRKREHEGDDEGFDVGQDFETSSYSGFPSGSGDFSTPPSSGYHSPRMRSTPLSPLLQPPAIQQVTPLRFMPSPAQGLYKQPSPMGLGGGMAGGGMGGGAGSFGSLSPVNLGQHRGDHSMRQGPCPTFLSPQSHEIQEAFPMRLSFDRENRLEGGKTSLSDSFESYPPRSPLKSPGSNLPQLRGSGQGLDFGGSSRFQPGQMHYDPRGQLGLGAREEAYDSPRGLAMGGIRGREGLSGLALHGLEMGRTGGLQGIGEMTGASLFQEDRRTDSLAFSRSLDMISDNMGGPRVDLSPHLALASMSKQPQSLFLQQQRQHQQLQQHREIQNNFGGNVLGQYNPVHTQQYQDQQQYHEDREEATNITNPSKNSPSTVGSHSTEGNGKKEGEDKISGLQDEERDTFIDPTDESNYIEEDQYQQQRL